MKQVKIEDNGGRDDVDYRYTLKFRTDSREQALQLFRMLEEMTRAGSLKLWDEGTL